MNSAIQAARNSSLRSGGASREGDAFKQIAISHGTGSLLKMCLNRPLVKKVQVQPQRGGEGKKKNNGKKPSQLPPREMFSSYCHIRNIHGNFLLRKSNQTEQSIHLQWQSCKGHGGGGHSLSSSESETSGVGGNRSAHHLSRSVIVRGVLEDGVMSKIHPRPLSETEGSLTSLRAVGGRRRSLWADVFAPLEFILQAESDVIIHPFAKRLKED